MRELSALFSPRRKTNALTPPPYSSRGHDFFHLRESHAPLTGGDAMREVHRNFLCLVIYLQGDAAAGRRDGAGKSLLEDDEVRPHLGQRDVLTLKVENHADLGRMGWTGSEHRIQ